MFKYYYFILFTCLFTFGQQKMNITNEARYELTFREYKNQKPEFLKNTFILLFNEKESFLKNMSLYVRDSLVDNGKIKKTGDSQKDFPVFSKYSTFMQLKSSSVFINLFWLLLPPLAIAAILPDLWVKSLMILSDSPNALLKSTIASSLYNDIF